MSFLRRATELGTAIPVLLLFALGADLASRTIPRSRYSFRAWEAMDNPDDPHAPLLPGRRYASDRVYGDLAALANLPAQRQIQSEELSSDPWGFRSSGARADQLPPGAILGGDSFAVAGAQDDQTLAARLAELSALRVYNGGGRTLGWNVLLEVARRLHLARGTVIYEYLDRLPVPLPPYSIVPPGSARPAASVRRLLQDAFGFSPLHVYLRRALRRIEDDRILPNPLGRQAIQARLRDGTPMLFLPADDASPVEADPDRNLRYWRWAAAELRHSGLTLLLVIVPNKTEVYAPLAQDYHPLHLGDGRGHGRLLESLRRDGIVALDLTPILRERAREALQEGRLLYRRDDTHWNEEGIRVAALEIYKVWKEEILDPSHR